MKTFRLLGIIGDPIAHSLSPAMHNAVLRKGGYPYLYLPFHVTPKRLKDFLRDATSLNLAGFNATIPHKETLMRHLAWISPEAKAIGAANTVVVSPSGLKGYNTDAGGYLRSLTEGTGFQPKGKAAIILGAGGAARAVVYALARAGLKEIVVANRTRSRARRLAQEFSKKFPRTRIVDVPFESGLLNGLLPDTDLLVNTTSVGMNRTSFKGLDVRRLGKNAVVSDLVYKPLLTPLLRSAKRRGLSIHTGEGMLLHQGAEAFRLWTGRKPDLRTMKKALLQALKRS
jgi:shikimate dehydrogenase